MTKIAGMVTCNCHHCHHQDYYHYYYSYGDHDHNGDHYHHDDSLITKVAHTAVAFSRAVELVDLLDVEPVTALIVKFKHCQCHWGGGMG